MMQFDFVTNALETEMTKYALIKPQHTREHE